MSKIYEALVRAERERLNDPADDQLTDAGSESTGTAEAASLSARPAAPVAIAEPPMPAPGFAEAQSIRAAAPASAFPPVRESAAAAAPVEFFPGSLHADSFSSDVLHEDAPLTTATAAQPAPTNPASVVNDAVSGNLPGIAARPWSPTLQNLPALAGRGNAAEQFRSLRSRLYDYRGFHKLKTVLVSSAAAEEGKSYVAANLAISLARHRNTRVLLIDGDLRRFSLQTAFGTTSAPGLSEFLAGRATALQIMQRAEVAPDSEATAALANLTFIPGGSPDERSADLSGSPRFQELISFAAPYFDWVIVDSSPVGLVSDAVNLGRFCDGVLLVVREGLTRYEAAQRAIAEFQATSVLGVVLNASTHAPELNYYSYSSTPEQK